MPEVLDAPQRAPNVRALLDHSARVTKVRARAPLRLGFAGGGTDVSPYSDTFGGCVLNATISMFAHCSIEVRNDQKVKFVALDYEQEVEAHTDADIAPSGPLALHKAVYRRIVRQYLGGACLPVTVMTASDAPAGSGLGSSSTLVVAMIEAYRELLALPLGEYDVAHLAYVIEREDVGQAGGRQDQYPATFGGINFIEFSAGQAIVNPLRIRQSTLMELEAMLVLYLTGISRESAKIIAQQSATLRSGHEVALQAMHQIKRETYVMKDALLHNDLLAFSDTLGLAGKPRSGRRRDYQRRDQPDPRHGVVRRRAVGQGLRCRWWGLPIFHGCARSDGRASCRRWHASRALLCVAALLKAAPTLGVSACAPRYLLLALTRLRHALEDRFGVQDGLLLPPLVIVSHERVLRLRLLRCTGGDAGKGETGEQQAHFSQSIGPRPRF